MHDHMMFYLREETFCDSARSLVCFVALNFLVCRLFPHSRVHFSKAQTSVLSALPPLQWSLSAAPALCPLLLSTQRSSSSRLPGACSPPQPVSRSHATIVATPNAIRRPPPAATTPLARTHLHTQRHVHSKCSSECGGEQADFSCGCSHYCPPQPPRCSASIAQHRSSCMQILASGTLPQWRPVQIQTRSKRCAGCECCEQGEAGRSGKADGQQREQRSPARLSHQQQLRTLVRLDEARSAQCGQCRRAQRQPAAACRSAAATGGQRQLAAEDQPPA